MGHFSLIGSENGLEYIDKFWLFINYELNGTKSIKQIQTLIGIIEFENTAIDNDFHLIVFFRLWPLVEMTTQISFFIKSAVGKWVILH